jgi:hypothetical protein
MTPRQIRAGRVAVGFMPRLWAFAYPLQGRRWRPLRLVAFTAWSRLFAWHWSRSER